MQVNASIDESDVGRMRPGQVVTFRVDAYPNETFHGSVKQVRLNPVTVQNVVTYSTVIDVPNPELKLKPGMTANVTIEIARRENVLRVPNARAPVPADQGHLRRAEPGRCRPSSNAASAAATRRPAERRARALRSGGPAGGARAGQPAPSAAPAAAPATAPAAPQRTAPHGRKQRDRPAASATDSPAAPRAGRTAAARRGAERPRRRTERPGRRGRTAAAARAARRLRQHDAGRAPEADGRADGGDDAGRARAVPGAHAPAPGGRRRPRRSRRRPGGPAAAARAWATASGGGNNRGQTRPRRAAAGRPGQGGSNRAAAPGTAGRATRSPRR